MNNMPNQLQIAEQALASLKVHTGMQGNWLAGGNSLSHGIEGEVQLDVNGKQLTFHVEVKRELRAYHMDRLIELASRHMPLLLIADRLYPAQKEQLREHQISYLDLSGNVYIRNGDVFIWIEGQKGAYHGKEARKTNRAFTKAGLKVVFALLQNPDAINYSYRELASFAGVALGTINEVMIALKEAGYLLRMNRTRMILDNKKQLLEHWLMGYGNVLKPSMLAGSYQMHDTLNWKKAKLPEGVLWGGEPAADMLTGHLSPEQWTIYFSHSKIEVAKALQLVPRQEGNVKLYKKFWTDAASDTQSIVSPDLITYADLLLTGDQRCIETANIIYEQKLNNLFGS